MASSSPQLPGLFCVPFLLTKGDNVLGGKCARWGKMKDAGRFKLLYL